MSNKKPIAADFETEAIAPRPKYPPRPVGVAIRWPGRRAKYLAWGHPAGNNCTREDADAELARVYYSKAPVVFHNAAFDLDVWGTFMAAPVPEPGRCRDTMVMGFLDDPHSRQLGLKELGPRLLGREPSARDKLREWILGNVPEARGKPKQWGAFIASAPGDLVAPYAIDDAVFTADLHDLLWKRICDAGMEGAHLREMRLIPALLENERLGIRVNLPQLEHDVAVYGKELAKADRWVQKYLATPDLNLDANEDLADAIERRFPEARFLTTEKGARSVSKESLAQAVEDAALIAVLEYRATLATCLSTFMAPWLEVARETGGLIHTRWRATAQDTGGGTRTGRLASSPNFQNIPTLEKIEVSEAAVRRLRLKFFPLPRVRSYIVADDSKSVLIDRDFSQQEPRILAHFEGDRLAAAYRADPGLDVYVGMGAEVKAHTGLVVARKPMKTLVLALIYGLGNGHLAERLDCTVTEAVNVKRALLRAYPGIDDLARELKRRAKANEPMRTWGGRVYYVEPPKVIKGKVREFAYKLVNYLIQGTAGDMLKEAIIRYHEHSERRGRFLLTAHDEVLASVPARHATREMALLKDVMEGLPGFDVPFTSDGTHGLNWNDMEDCE